MLSVSQVRATLFFPKQPAVFLAVSANSQPSSHRPWANRKQQQRIPKTKEENQNGNSKRGELSGLDVLWAMQKAAAEKKKTINSKKRNKNKKRDDVLLSDGRQKQKKDTDTIDYSDVRPLRIKSDWGCRLDLLEKRLKLLFDDSQLT